MCHSYAARRCLIEQAGVLIWSFLGNGKKNKVFRGVLGNNPAEAGSVITKISDPWDFYWFVALFCITLDVTEPGAATTR